ncbi:MAG: aminopeptidase P family protein [Deltaproteobacteria bacterium]|nr:aminopeptidase P family protein [Deltaproteobacteria bacterium]
MSTRRLARIRSLKKQFDSCKDYDSVLLLSSAPPVTRTRDEHHEYRQNSNIYYLTGSQAPDFNLLVGKNFKNPLLIVRKLTERELVRDGAPPSLKPVAKELGAELIVVDNPRKEILARLSGHSHLYFDNMPGSLSWIIAHDLIAMPSHERGRMPLHFSHCDGVLQNLRAIKDKEEIALIRRANEITNEGLLYIAPRIRAGLSESQVARTIEYVFRMNDATTSFGTIVGSGPSGATLHHRNLQRKLRAGELVLIDCGAEYKLYCGDITRVLPVSGKFTDAQRDLYDIVLASQEAALKQVRPGVQIRKVYDAAARILTEGLVDLKVLRGKVSALMEKRAYLPYFPHTIGHSLGIDVHDVGDFLPGQQSHLQEGMVFTIEPGLYFRHKVGKVPACGIRIEDNLLVTRRGHEILSAGFPKDTRQIEDLMATY